MKQWVIYALIDPRDNAVRYVGWTSNLRVRLRDHQKPSQLAKGQRRDRWLSLLRRLGLTPAHAVLETGSGDWAEAERRWIAHHRAMGADLTNHTDGGEGTPGHLHTEAAKAAMSAKRKGRPPSEKSIQRSIELFTGVSRPRYIIEAMAAANRGRPKSEAQKAKQAAAMSGRSASPEVRAKLSAVQIGKRRGPVSEEARARVAAAARDPSRRAKVAEAKRLYWERWRAARA